MPTAFDHCEIQQKPELQYRGRPSHCDTASPSLPVAECGTDRPVKCEQVRETTAFFPPDHMPEIWKATLKLNKLRNDIAHNLCSKASLSDKVAAWVQLVPSTLTGGPDAQQNFELALWSLFEAISSLVDQPSAELVALRLSESAA